MFGTERGHEFTVLSVATIRAVALGWVGIAFIRAMAVGLVPAPSRPALQAIPFVALRRRRSRDTGR